jgi:hypothetical protein
MALAPDNQAYNIKGEYAHAFPQWANAHIDATVALGRMTQNADLLAPSVNTGIGGVAPFTWNNADWNTTAALSQRSADARIDTRLLNLQLSLAPADRVTVRAKARYYQTINHTAYTAYNPLTGQYGYLAEGGGQGTVVPGESGIYSPATGVVQYRAIPFDGSQFNMGADADLRVANATTLTASYERENYLRHFRERDRTWEDKLKFMVIERLAEGTLRASYEYDRRSGSAYNSDPYGAFYTSSLPGAPPNLTPFTLADLRKYDLADRRQHLINLRYNRALREDMDAGITLQHKRILWGAEFGRVDPQTLTSLNLDLGWSPADGTTAYTFYSYERGSISQANVNDNAANMEGSASYGGDVYLTQNAWRVNSLDRTDVFGLGLKKAWQNGYVLDVTYSLTRSNTAVTYSYLDAGGAVLGAPGTPLPDVGNAFPDLTSRLHALQASLLMPVSKRSSVRGLLRYESTVLADWHYTGLTAGALPSNAGGLSPVTFIDLGPSNYHALMLGVFYQYKL